jgi:redox-sensitive bicupin YhaK (pirin superfamily)
MNTQPQPARIVPAMEITEGAGVNVHRTIGTPALRNYDPFMLLDHISSNNPEDYTAGFSLHPHRDFTTFSYIIDGDMEHKDSMGNRVNRPGHA